MKIIGDKVPSSLKAKLGKQQDTFGSKGSLALKNKLKSQVEAIKKSMK